jgi:hypothetical protein
MHILYSALFAMVASAGASFVFAICAEGTPLMYRLGTKAYLWTGSISSLVIGALTASCLWIGGHGLHALIILATTVPAGSVASLCLYLKFRHVD